MEDENPVNHRLKMTHDNDDWWASDGEYWKKKTVVNMCLELDECFCQMADIFKSSLKTSGSHWDWTGHVIG